MTDYDELRRLSEAATPGPWTSGLTGMALASLNDPNPCVLWSGTMAIITIGSPWLSEERSAANARFIAAARTAIPELLDALEAARKDAEELRKRVSTLHVERLLDVLDDIESDCGKPEEERLYLREHLMPQLLEIHSLVEKRNE